MLREVPRDAVSAVRPAFHGYRDGGEPLVEHILRPLIQFARNHIPDEMEQVPPPLPPALAEPRLSVSLTFFASDFLAGVHMDGGGGGFLPFLERRAENLFPRFSPKSRSPGPPLSGYRWGGAVNFGVLQ